MRIQCDTLLYAKMLEKEGIKSDTAQGVMTMLTQIEIFNIYAKQEVDSMLSEAVKEVFVRQDKKIDEQRREFDVRMEDNAKYHEQRLRDNKSELLASRRWMIGTVITVGLSVVTYLSALLHFSH
jgi:hypothetical protein